MRSDLNEISIKINRKKSAKELLANMRVDNNILTKVFKLICRYSIKLALKEKIMRTLAITLIVLTTNTSFAASKCQDFVKAIFNQYGLSLPGTSNFPAHGNFNLENFDQFMPEFTITTTPRKVSKESSKYKKAKLITRKDHLFFSGKVIEDGTYQFIVAEIRPEPKRGLGENNIDMIFDKPQPITHRFMFSKDCKFKGYAVNMLPPALSIKKAGFEVSADNACKFDDPAPQPGKLNAHKVGGRKTFITTSKLNLSKGGLLKKETKMTEDYISLMYPDYYRKLCALAKESTKDEELEQNFQEKNKGSKSVSL